MTTGGTRLPPDPTGRAGHNAITWRREASSSARTNPPAPQTEWTPAMVIMLIVAFLLLLAFVPAAVSASRDRGGRTYDRAYTRARSAPRQPRGSPPPKTRARPATPV